MKISVITPIYNAEPYLSTPQKQTLPFGLIIDSSSSDKTIEIAQKYT